MMSFQRQHRVILVAMDHSEPAQWALESAIWLAGDLSGGLPVELVIATVVEPQSIDRENPIAATEADEAHRAGAEKLLKAARLRASSRVPAKAVLLFGPASREIVAAARRCDAAYIVIGTRGRGRVAQLLLGSTAIAVIREAPCPVLAVAHEPRALRRRPAAGETSACATTQSGTPARTAPAAQSLACCT